MERHCAQRILCKKAKSKVLPKDLHTSLPVSDIPWVDLLMDFIVGYQEQKGRGEGFYFCGC